MASNFAHTMKALTSEFEAQSGHDVTLAFGSTGKHYAQIVNGAPFDMFFAADAERPRLLELTGITVPGTRFTYALGRLVLWSRDPTRIDDSGEILAAGDFRFLAIANPRLAPYGRAAREVLERRGLWSGLQEKIVRGENVSQAYQFVKSGNAQLGFVAWSHIVAQDGGANGSYWLPPDSLYAPIEQQALLLEDTAATRAFLAFMQSDRAREVIRSHGYLTP